MFLGPFHILALVYNVFSLSDSLSLPFMTNASKSPILHVPIYTLHVLSGKRGRQALQYTNSYRLDTPSHSHASVLPPQCSHSCASQPQHSWDRPGSCSGHHTHATSQTN